MATPCFYHRELNEQDGLIELSSSESIHLSKSRRLKPSDQVKLINGKGLTAFAEVVNVKNRRVQVGCSKFETSLPSSSRISIATGVPKGDRAKVMIDMLTQLAVTRVIPLRCDYSETRFNEKHREKWQRIAIEACKQSQNPWLPYIEAEWQFTNLLDDLESFKNNDDDALPQVIYANVSGQKAATLADLKNELIVLIGPEGGLSDSERAILKSRKATPMTLGDHILRTELAAVLAMSQLRSRVL